MAVGGGGSGERSCLSAMHFLDFLRFKNLVFHNFPTKNFSLRGVAAVLTPLLKSASLRTAAWLNISQLRSQILLKRECWISAMHDA